MSAPAEDVNLFLCTYAPGTLRQVSAGLVLRMSMISADRAFILRWTPLVLAPDEENDSLSRKEMIILQKLVWQPRYPHRLISGRRK